MKTKKALDPKNLKELIHRCIILTDRKGVVIDRESNPGMKRLSMFFAKDNIRIRFSITESARSGGIYLLEVRQRGAVILRVSDSFPTSYSYPCKPRVEDYTPGNWEKRIPPVGNS